MAWPWLWSQRWTDLLFQHWPVEVTKLRPLVPERLDIEQYEGTAWVAVTPFRISRMGFRGAPIPPFAISELNVRTYVTDGRRSGVWFLSLDAASRFFVMAGRGMYRLPYVFAGIRTRREGSRIRYEATRPDGTAFTATYGPSGIAFRPAPGSFDHWCVERYCLYAGAGPRLWRAEIAHAPWELSPATVAIERNDMLSVHGLAASGPAAPPRYASPLDVVIGPPVSLRLFPTGAP